MVDLTPVVNGRNSGFELRKFQVVNEGGTVIREQLGLAGVKVGEIIRNTEDNTVWKVIGEPVHNKAGVLGVEAIPYTIDELAAVQESWHRAKNHVPHITKE